MTISLAIASGKGGVGKTTIAVNLAITLQRMGSRVTMMDADFGLANAHILMGQNPKITMSDVLAGESSVEDALSEGPAGIKFLSGGSGLLDMLNLDAEARYRTIRALDDIENQTDVLMVDTPAGASDSTLSFVLASDKVLVVIVGEPTSLMDAYAMIKAAHMEQQVDKFSVVVNMVRDADQGVAHFEKFRAITRRFLDVELSYAGHVPQSQALRNSIVRRSPIALHPEHTRENRAFEAIAREVLRAPFRGGQGVRFFNSNR